MSGHYAADYKVEKGKKKATFTYYDEEGNLLWSKVVSDQEWPDVHSVNISYEGSVIVVSKGNPHWSLEEERTDVNLNVNKLSYYDAKGNLLSEYSGFRNLSIGKLSDDGEYYAGILWWSKGVDRGENRLVYIRTKDGKALWERPFVGYYNVDSGESIDLAISEKGSYVGAVKLGLESFRDEDAEVHVFEKDGDMIVRIKGGEIDNIYETGLAMVGDVGLVDIKKQKILDMYFNPHNYLRHTMEKVWEAKKGYVGKVGKIISRRYESVDGSVIWNIPIKYLDATFYNTDNGQYFKVIKSNETGEIKILKLKIGGAK